jgi:hypothetical protein
VYGGLRLLCENNCGAEETIECLAQVQSNFPGCLWLMLSQGLPDTKRRKAV